MTAGTQEQRSAERVNLFVMASLHAAANGGPVKLRNISPVGALVESERLPAVGEPVELRRGNLAVAGTVVWQANGRAGLRFSQRTDTSDWLPTAAAQKNVDQTFQRLRTEHHHLARDASRAAPLHSSFISVEDMQRVAASLDDLADELANDDAVVFKHAMKLQALDIASQMLRKLAARQD